MATSFGAWIKRRRRALDLTQEQLAAVVGCSPEMIRKIEAGGRRPSREIAGLLARSLQIPDEERPAFLQQARTPLPAAADAPIVAPAPVVLVEPPAPPLPAPAAPLVGREAELRRLAEMVDNPACRVITLVGPGGIGKTRVALEAAHRLAERFTDGARFVSLAAVTEPGLVAATIATALRVPLQGSGELAHQLAHYLDDKHLLLALDNMEHLLDALPTVTQLVDRAPRLTVLVTSRERLNIVGEWVFDLQGLAIHAARAAGEPGEAVTLFLQTARRVDSAFAPTAAEQEAIIRICRLVDGLPLGIELAAAWVRTLSCVEIAEEVGKNVAFLTATQRDLPARHRSLEAVFAYSWNLLADDERAVLAKLTTFCGGWSRDAGHAIAGATLPLLGALVDKSLVRRLDRARFDLHEVVRQFAAAKLNHLTTEQMAAETAHAAYYARWLQAQDQPLRRADQPATAAIGLEIENVRSAWREAIARADPLLVEAMIAPLSYFYEAQGWLREGEALFRGATAAYEQSIPDGQRGAADHGRVLGHLLALQSAFTWRIGRLVEAESLLTRSLALLRPLPPSPALLSALYNLGVLRKLMGDTRGGRQYLDESLGLARTVGDDEVVASALLQLGLIADAEGGYDAAYHLMREALERVERLGDVRGRIWTLSFLSGTALSLGRLDEAEALARKSLALNSRIGDRWLMSNALNQLGLVAQRRDEPVAAEYFFKESLAISTEVGDVGIQAWTLNRLGMVARARGEGMEARQDFVTALTLAAKAHNLPMALESLLGLAGLSVDDGDVDRAREWLWIILTHPASNQFTRDGATALRAALARAPNANDETAPPGRPRTLDEAIAELLTPRPK